MYMVTIMLNPTSIRLDPGSQVWGFFGLMVSPIDDCTWDLISSAFTSLDNYFTDTSYFTIAFNCNGWNQKSYY